MSFRLIESSGLSLLANLKELEVFKAAHNSLNTSEESLIFFFKSMKKLHYVDISGASCINSEAIEVLANNNKNLTHLILNTYLLSCDVLHLVKEKCPIKFIKFSPSMTITQ